MFETKFSSKRDVANLPRDNFAYLFSFAHPALVRSGGHVFLKKFTPLHFFLLHCVSLLRHGVILVEISDEF